MVQVLESNVKETMGATLSKYYNIVMAMNRFPTNIDVSIEELAESADVHWNTAKKALIFFNAVNPLVPDFKIQKEHGFRLLSKPKATIAIDNIFLSNEMRITSKMMFEKITSRSRAQGIFELRGFLEEEEISYITILIQKGLINSEEGRFYLSSKGKIIANLAIKELVDLGIPLPWEEREKKHASKSVPDLVNSRLCTIFTFTPTWKMENILKKRKKTSLFAVV